MPSQRVEQALERLSEDETMFADLDDAGAAALRGWIEREIGAADDATDFEGRVAEIRRAARTAARVDGDPVAAARAALAAGPSRKAPARSKKVAYRAAAARLLAPAEDATASSAAALLTPAPQASGDATPSPAAALLTPAPQVPATLHASEPAAKQRASEAPAEPAAPAKSRRRPQSRHRRSRWRYRKAS